ncbi:hypothetical protein FF1_000958 [Malus domestica]
MRSLSLCFSLTLSGRPSRCSSCSRRGQPQQQPQSLNFPLQNPINPTQNLGFTHPQVSSSAVFRPQLYGFSSIESLEAVAAFLEKYTGQ